MNVKRSKVQNLDWHTHLKRFLMRVNELKGTRFYSNQFWPKLTISRKEKEKAKFELPEPDIEDLRSFLTIYRQFISDGEPIFISRILNIGTQHIKDSRFIYDLVACRNNLNAFQKCSGLRLISKASGKEIPPKETCKLWISYYLHTDEDKLLELESLTESEWYNYRFQFFGYISETTQLIVYVADILSKALESNALVINAH